MFPHTLVLGACPDYIEVPNRIATNPGNKIRALLLLLPPESAEMTSVQPAWHGRFEGFDIFLSAYTDDYLTLR